MLPHSYLPLYYQDLAKAEDRAVQSVLVPRAKFSIAAAKKWVTSHGYSITKPPDVTRTYFRFRQRDPSEFSRLRTVVLGNGIKLIVGYKG